MLRRIGQLGRKSWSTLRQSRLGMIGFVLVLIFALVAILAPFISPYPRTFLAPDADRFKVNVFDQGLPQNLTYQGPVLGPTTPLNNAVGVIWELNYNSSAGLVFMNELHYSLGLNESPFLASNLSRTFDITQDFGTPVPPGLPMHSLYYIVPASLESNQSVGPSIQNGAIAFFSGKDFVAADPFTKTYFFMDRLNFTPTYTGEDPASAGHMLLQPQQRAFAVGPVAYPVGPYEYFYATDLNQTVVYELQYVNAWSSTAPTGKIAFSSNASLSAPPFVYYNQFAVSDLNAYRAGPGQAILLPLSNGTLEVVNVTGSPVRAWIPLTLDGAPAKVVGNVGYQQTTSVPIYLYLPLQSANATGLAVLNLNTLGIVYEDVLGGPGWVPIGMPITRTGATMYAAYFDPADNTSSFVGFNESSSGTLYHVIPQLQVRMAGHVRSFFHVNENNEIFLLSGDSKVYTLATTFGASSQSVTPNQFPVFPSPTVTSIVYAGSFKGTLYGSLSTQELNGAFTDSARPFTTVFQLQGTPRTPLPPGRYPSGNTYLWGTDFFGGDILTEWIYGTQVAFIVGLLAALFSVGIGTLVGVISGYYGKTLDTLLMRTTDVFLVLPFLPIVLVLIAITSPSIWIIILVIAILGWPGIARVIRAQVLSIKERPFIDAARVSGASDMRLVFLHIAPNVLPFSFLYMSLSVGGAIITEAALSFLGFGDPRVTSWGGMLSNLLTFSGSLHAWWWLLPPGLGITFLSLGFYLIGRGFDEVINPRLRRR